MNISRRRLARARALRQAAILYFTVVQRKKSCKCTHAELLFYSRPRTNVLCFMSAQNKVFTYPNHYLCALSAPALRCAPQK